MSVLLHPVLMKQLLEMTQVLDTSILKKLANFIELFIQVRQTDNTNLEARQLLIDLKEELLGKIHEKGISDRKEPG